MKKERAQRDIPEASIDEIMKFPVNFPEKKKTQLEFNSTGSQVEDMKFFIERGKRLDQELTDFIPKEWWEELRTIFKLKNLTIRRARMRTIMSIRKRPAMDPTKIHNSESDSADELSMTIFKLNFKLTFKLNLG